MKISIPRETRQTIGGGHSFTNNLEKGLKKNGIEISKCWEDADVVLISGASMITKELFRTIKESKKKIVLRVDNFLRPSRNSNSGHTKMLEMAVGVDAVVYQSEWSKYILKDYLTRDGVIIHNSVDEEIFNPTGAYMSFRDKGNPVYLYSRFGRDDLKLWGKAYYDFVDIYKKNNNAHFVIVGRFNRDLINYDFDFFQGESFEYKGVIEDALQMSIAYRGCDYVMAPYKFDSFSNTYIEALMCGCKLYDPDLSGGTGEMIELWQEKGREHFSLSRMAKEYLNLFRSL